MGIFIEIMKIVLPTIVGGIFTFSYNEIYI